MSTCTLLERSLHGGFVIVHPHRLNNAGECHKAVTHERRAPRPSERRDPKALEAIRQAVVNRAKVESALVHAVAAARDAHYSWAAIGVLLGTSGEAARQRYAQLIAH